MVRLLVEGWFDYPHSYSLVNIMQVLHLDREIIKEVYLRELSPYKENWSRIDLLETGILTHAQNKQLQQIPKWQGEPVDIVYRIATPLFTNTMEGVPTVLFYTAEFQSMSHLLYEPGNLDTVINKVKEGKMVLITPSVWSAEAALQEGVEPCIVPHGVDTTMYYPDMTAGQELRKDLGIPSHAHVLLSVGAMTQNKNTIEILRAFYKLSLTRDNVYLILKGLDDMYNSHDYIRDAIKQLIAEGSVHAKTWTTLCKDNRFIYLNETLSTNDMRALYNAADIYVAPYIAEGFCIPVLDAMACGVPCMVSKGGATDDFISPTCDVTCPAIKMKNDHGQHFLRPIPLSIHDTLLGMLDNVKTLKQKAKKHTKVVQANFGWDVIGKRLSTVLAGIVFHTSHPSHPLGHNATQNKTL